MKISPPALCIVSVLVCVQSDPGAGGPHQERQNRLLPGFEPFDHPSKKIGDPSSPTAKVSRGPISEVEWVEQVVPVFGKIQIQKKVGTADSSSNKMPLIITLVVGGCLLCGVLIKQKSRVHSVEQKTVNKQKENLSEIQVCNIEPDIPPAMVTTGNQKRSQDACR